MPVSHMLVAVAAVL